MPIAWHSERWWNVCMSEDKKKAQFLLSNASNLYNMEVLKHFDTENYGWILDIF